MTKLMVTCCIDPLNTSDELELRLLANIYTENSLSSAEELVSLLTPVGGYRGYSTTADYQEELLAWTFGAEKHAKHSWRNHTAYAENWSEAVENRTDSYFRHFISYGRDTESGALHSAHKVCNARILLQLMQTKED